MCASGIGSKVKSVKPAFPQIYAYTTPDIPSHDGWTKIGYAGEQDVWTRIRQQTHTVDVEPKLEWYGNAVFEGTNETFKDHAFHAYLVKKKYERKDSTEWFRVDPQEAHTRFFEFKWNRGVDETHATDSYVLRREQKQAVEDAWIYASSHEDGEFLWNAKPRFGKTLATYDLCKELEAKTVLIVTNRPAIANSWYSDYAKFLGAESGYSFISSVDALAGKSGVMTREEYVRTHSKTPASENKFIEFVSLQDLKGGIQFGGNYNKLQHVAKIKWDVLVIDEAHEGVDTYKTDVAFDHIARRFTLHLSGTPFKAIANDKFPQDAIFNWTYADEQEAKRDWNDDDGTNPYEDLPRLNLFTYKMSDIVEDEVSRGVDIDGESVEYAFDLNEFFSVKNNGDFVHDADVDKFLDALTYQEKFPFSTEELRNELKHTFWMLNRVDSARALAKKLKNHPVFKDYEIVLAAGDGKIDDGDETAKSFDKVRKAIAENDKTITLSVGQLTTGVTIPEWTAVLMLSNMKSPSLYIQTAFRAQNPCLFFENGAYLRKENAYVFDFDPARTLTIFEEYANDLYSDTSAGRGDADARKQRVRTLLNFFPVYGEDEDGEMVELDAEKVLSIPRAIRAREVVRHGFMSDFLFQNIGCIFRAPKEVVDIINKIEAVDKKSAGLVNNKDVADEIGADKNGDIELPNEKVVGLATELFGDKVYSDLSEGFNKVCENELKKYERANGTSEDQFMDRIREAFQKKVATPIAKIVKEELDSNISKNKREAIEKKVAKAATSELEKCISNYGIEKRSIEHDKEAALAEATTEEHAQHIEQEYAEKLEQIASDFREDLTSLSDDLVQQAGETVVREIEMDKRETEKKGYEDVVRNHLRGFSRTIPSFLMAYGDENTTLANFDDYTEDDVFLEVTGITEDQFRFLRDGGPYENPDTGQTENFPGHLFDEVVFNDSVKEFMRLKDELSDYFDETHDEDIFDYIPPQKTNQIFTPRWVVKLMVDNLEEENPGCYDDPNATFADLYMKSGLYITEIVKKLFNSDGLKSAYPDEDERIRHILQKQVYGMAPTRIIYLIATNFIFGFDDELKRTTTHFVQADAAEAAKNGTLDELVDQYFKED